MIDTRGAAIQNEPKITANFKIIYHGPGMINHITDTVFHYNNDIGIELRGNSSQYYPQKQYGIETKDSITGDDLSISLLDMPEENDWVLYAPITTYPCSGTPLCTTFGTRWDIGAPGLNSAN